MKKLPPLNLRRKDKPRRKSKEVPIPFRMMNMNECLPANSKSAAIEGGSEEKKANMKGRAKKVV